MAIVLISAAFLIIIAAMVFDLTYRIDVSEEEYQAKVDECNELSLAKESAKSLHEKEYYEWLLMSAVEDLRTLRAPRMGVV